MTVRYQLVIDAADPEAQAAFWAEALHYTLEPPPADFGNWKDYWLSIGVPEDDAGGDGIDRIVDPASEAPRIWFQPVPEGNPAGPTTDGTTERAHNKLRLDLHVGPERRSEVVEQLVAAGARRLWDGQGGGSTWVTTTNPEGNEFCVARASTRWPAVRRLASGGRRRPCREVEFVSPSRRPKGRSAVGARRPWMDTGRKGSAAPDRAEPSRAAQADQFLL